MNVWVPHRGEMAERGAACSERAPRALERWRECQDHFQDVGKDPLRFTFLFVKEDEIPTLQGLAVTRCVRQSFMNPHFVCHLLFSVVVCDDDDAPEREKIGK